MRKFESAPETYPLLSRLPAFTKRHKSEKAKALDEAQFEALHALAWCSDVVDDDGLPKWSNVLDPVRSVFKLYYMYL